MIVFIIIWSIWFLSEILLNRFLRSGKEADKNQDKGSIRIIWIVIGVANNLGILAAIFIRFPISGCIWVPYVGLLLIVLGMIFRFIAVLTLGRLFTVDVTIQENHKIKKDGIYRLIRHPSYTGSILSFLGFGLSLNNWISLTIIVVPVFCAFIYRIRIEEKLLTDRFGEAYATYMEKTYRLIPWLY
jgi:protein-S-isoprenylcysteine O-methyltransferase Ste14